MTAARGMAIATAAVVTASVGLTTSGGAETAELSVRTAMAVAAPTAPGVGGRVRPRGAVEDCGSSSGWPGGSVREFASRSNLVVGPLALEGAGVTLGYAESVGGNKLLVHVRGGNRVTLELPRRTRVDVGLGFGAPLGATRASKWSIRNTRRVVTFRACERGESSRVSEDWPEWPVTAWVGWLLATAPRCVPLLVWVNDEPSPRRAVIKFGVPSCA